MKKRKVLLIFLAVIMSVTTVFTACDDSSSNATNNSSQSTTGNTEEEGNQPTADDDINNSNQGETSDDWLDIVNGCNHRYYTEYINATCGKDGLITHTCSFCNDVFTERIPATGKHTWKSGECNSPAKCLVCNEFLGFNGVLHEYNSTGTCILCNETPVSVILPNVPVECTRYYGGEYKDISFQVASLNYTIKLYDDRCEITFKGFAKCTYNASGDNKSETMPIKYKLYDENNVIVKSGSIIPGRCTVGETVEFEEIIYHLPKKSTLRLEIMKYV